MSDVKPTRDEINALRLKAFATNSHDDRMAYYKACSGWFQDEDHRELERADEITALRSRLAEVEAERDGWHDRAAVAVRGRKAAEAALASAALRGWMLGRDAALEAVTQSLCIGSEAAAIRALVPPADLTAQVKEAGE